MVDSSRKFAGAGWFSLAWLAVNAAGWGLGFGLEFWVIHTIGAGSLATLFGSLISAGVIGLAEWLALRWLMPRLGSGSQGIAWVILTMFGFSAGFVVGALIAGLVGTSESPVALALVTFVSWAMVGALTGILQWMSLRLVARGAVWWVGANAVGYGLGAVLTSAIRIDQTAIPITYALTGLVVGIATLVALSRLRRPA
jgi:hypothetical protein